MTGGNMAGQQQPGGRAWVGGASFDGGARTGLWSPQDQARQAEGDAFLRQNPHLRQAGWVDPMGEQAPSRAIASPASAFGKGQMPTQYETPGVNPMGSPSGDAAPMDTDYSVLRADPGMKPMRTGDMNPGYVGQAMSQPAQQSTTQAALANTNAVAAYNPWGQTQQQLGPSYHPYGSPLGGYFRPDNSYVPNAGNAMNGMDTLARFGLNWRGMPAGPIGVQFGGR